MITRSHETGSVTGPVMPKRYGTVTRPETEYIYGTKGGRDKKYKSVPMGQSGPALHFRCAHPKDLTHLRSLRFLFTFRVARPTHPPLRLASIRDLG